GKPDGAGYVVSGAQRACERKEGVRVAFLKRLQPAKQVGIRLQTREADHAPGGERERNRAGDADDGGTDAAGSDGPRRKRPEKHLGCQRSGHRPSPLGTRTEAPDSRSGEGEERGQVRRLQRGQCRPPEEGDGITASVPDVEEPQ